MTDSNEPRVRVTAGPVPDGLRELQELREQLWSTEGWAIRRDMDGLQRTWNVFHGNWTQLDSMIGRFKTDTQFALDIWGSADERDRWNAFLDAMDLPLHNLIASAATLGDHTRVIANRRLAREQFDRYQQEVDRLFANHPRSRFVRDLRNYMLHYTLPATGGSFAFEKGGPFTHAITLNVSDLRKWDDWKPVAREYFDEVGDQLDLHNSLAAYYEDTESFHKWFGQHIDQANRDALAEAQAIADRGNAMVGPIRRQLEATEGDAQEVPYISGGFNQPP